MRLVTFGCSNTFGSFLPDTMDAPDVSLEPSKYAWPAVLSNKLGIECVNKGIGGVSNKLISYVLHNTTLYPTDIVVILWTYVDRWTIIKSDTGVMTEDDLQKYGPCSFIPKHHNIAGWSNSRESKSYYRYIYNETDHILDTNYRIDYANLYLNNKGIKNYHAACSSKESHDWTSSDNTNNHPLLLAINYGELQTIDKAADNVHPGIKSHSAIADAFYKEIE
tara:strand:+ start:435 stop:1097 length:663 start_codon:yes stop_codon:yes gene_type:complete